jgi:hypothetical protein
MIARKALYGARERLFQDSIDQTLSLETFSDLARAVALEFEQCRQVWEARCRGGRGSLYNLDTRLMKMIDPNPFVVFALLGAMKHGLRAAEVNSLSPQDLRVDEVHGMHELFVHAPNKANDYVPVDETFLLSWRFCESWSEEAHVMANGGGEEVVRDPCWVYPIARGTSYLLVRFNTYSFADSQLPYFLRKWFNHKIPNGQSKGRPLLHAQGDPTRPLKLSYSKLRNAFAVRFAERDRNRATASRVMRHRSAHTTQKYYMHQDRLDHAKKVQIALKVEAQFMALGLKNPVAAGVSEETLRRAREAGAMTPHGICGAAMEGKSCTRASDCLQCPHHTVLDTKKSQFLSDRDAYLALARGARSGGRSARGGERP